MNYKRFFAKNYVNAIGWRTNRKLMAIESDDWGATAMPSLEVAQKLKDVGVDIGTYFYKYDHLESNTDFEALYDVLSSVKDKNGHSAILSAECVVCNPNYESIEANGKTTYIPESIIDTYKRFRCCDKSYALFMQGIKERLIHPQFHGREHFHVKSLMEDINNNNPKKQLAFQLKASVVEGQRFSALDYCDPKEEPQMRTIITDGLNRFEQIFGFRTKSYVCPTNVLGLGINKIFADNGVLFSQTGQQYWRMADGSIKLNNYYWGQKDENNITYWRRNCTFEPTRNQDLDWVDRCLKEIAIAFFWGKPAVINSHRVNYIGSLYENNRTESLKKLKTLLSAVIKRWPTIEFIHSEGLATIIEHTP